MYNPAPVHNPWHSRHQRAPSAALTATSAHCYIDVWGLRHTSMLTPGACGPPPLSQRYYIEDHTPIGEGAQEMFLQATALAMLLAMLFLVPYGNWIDRAENTNIMDLMLLNVVLLQLTVVSQLFFTTYIPLFVAGAYYQHASARTHPASRLPLECGGSHKIHGALSTERRPPFLCAATGMIFMNSLVTVCLPPLMATILAPLNRPGDHADTNH